MATTITTTTITIATSAASASLVGIVIVTLIVLLIHKETVSGLHGPRAAWLSRALNVPLVPLIIVFLVALATRLVGILR